MEKLAKRIIVLTQIILVVSFVSLAGWLRRLDSSRIRQDVTALDALGTLASKSFPDIASQNETHKAMWSWLEKNDQGTNRHRLAVRTEITEWLADQNISILTEELAGKDQRASIREKKPFFIQQIDRLRPVRGDETPDPVVLRTGSAASVRDLIHRLRLFLGETLVSVVTKTVLPEAPRGHDLDFIRLEGSEIVIGMTYYPPPNIQEPIRSTEIRVPSEIKLIEGPSLWELRYSTEPESETLSRLHADTTRCEALEDMYGLLPLRDAAEVARRNMTAAYDSISVLGFSFSPRHFPFAVLFFSGLALLAIALSLGQARKGGGRILADVQVESAFDIVLDHSLARFVVWVVVPIVAIWLSRPALPLNQWETLTLNAGVVGLGVLGLSCFAWARKL